MPAASLASLTDFKVSNSEKSRNFRKNLKFRKKQKFPEKSEIPKKAEISEILCFEKILQKLFKFFCFIKWKKK